MGTLQNRLAKAVLTSTHNLCFEAKIRKNGIPQFCYIKVGFEGVNITRTCFRDEYTGKLTISLLRVILITL